jgi:hypothetical protein
MPFRSIENRHGVNEPGYEERLAGDDAAADAKAEAAAQEAEEREFARTPPGYARLAFERGDEVFQYSIDVISQRPLIVKFIGGVPQRSSDPVAILNAMCHEGWEIVSGSFVFVEHSQKSRENVLGGERSVTRGTVRGYYLFRRCEANRRSAADGGDA